MYLIGTHSMCPTTLKQRYIIRYSVYPMYIEWSTMEKVTIQLGSRPIVKRRDFVDAASIINSANSFHLVQY